ncbi:MULTISPECIES: FAD-dependent monooxygenase [unclassified Tardiphaga]|jgi:6-hydroxynicotinate 3-monooxygenase|uniref:FAD-dependent oxidoreductase n=1 Tax=unclassified Tardiphaga TaxID=2631404 RepID=UPI000E7725EB
MDRGTRIAVLGAGLAGLTVAGLLQRAGFPVAVYEQSPSFSRIGAGIILGANVSNVLRRLDLEDAFAATGIRPDAFLSRAWDTGEQLYRLDFDAECEARFGGPFVNIHRADLHQLLQRPLAPGTIRFGHKLTGIEERGDALTLRFENGTSAEADIAIGADGIRSITRELILGAEEPRFIGRSAPRAVFPASRIKGDAIDDCTKWWAPDRHTLAYYMTPDRNEVYVMAALPMARWDGDGSPVKGDRDEFIAAFDDAHPDLKRAVEAAEDVTVWPIFDRPRNDTWHKGRVVLMGDACHAVRPFMAAGGSAAIEDAAILSRCIAEFGDPATAFAHYTMIRIPRVADIQQISIANSWMHGPTETDWFFGYDACTVPFDRAIPEALCPNLQR